MAVIAWGVPDPRERSCPVPSWSSARWPTTTGMAWEAALPPQLCWQHGARLSRQSAQFLGMLPDALVAVR